jgi:hypothetical protein
LQQQHLQQQAQLLEQQHPQQQPEVGQYGQLQDFSGLVEVLILVRGVWAASAVFSSIGGCCLVGKLCSTEETCATQQPMNALVAA